MYDSEHIRRAESAMKRSINTVIVAVGILLAITIFMTIMRWQLYLSIATFVLGAILLLVWDAVLSPPVFYGKYLRGLDKSLVKEMDCDFMGFEDGHALRDGVPFFPLNVLDDEGIERLYYYDARMPLPAIPQRARIRVVHSGQFVRELEIY